MLTIRCAACKTKLWKYRKLGKGEVLRCHKSRIARMYDTRMEGDRICCPCGRAVGIDKGAHYAMIRRAFTSSGVKVNKL